MVARECAKNAKLTVREVSTSSSKVESPAEIKIARLLGGDAAGMSTVTEAHRSSLQYSFWALL